MIYGFMGNSSHTILVIQFPYMENASHTISIYGKSLIKDLSCNFLYL